MLLDNQSTLDLICNKRLTSGVNKSNTKLKLYVNCGTMTVIHMSKIPEYNKITWFRKKAITNIVSLKNMTKKYRVTYDNKNEMFVVHRK